jgi:HSP20 family protein
MTEKNIKEKSPTQNGRDSTALTIPSLGFPSVFQDFMKPFDEFMQPFFSGSTSSFWTELRGKEPNFDIQDRGDHFALTAELPGFDKKDIEVRVDSNVLELKAEKRSDEKNKNSEGKQSTYSYFHRYLTLPEQVLSEKIDGTMKNGVLALKLPKAEQKQKDSSRRVHLN